MLEDQGPAVFLFSPRNNISIADGVMNLDDSDKDIVCRSCLNLMTEVNLHQ
jgi:hypothetical protein